MYYFDIEMIWFYERSQLVASISWYRLQIRQQLTQIVNFHVWFFENLSALFWEVQLKQTDWLAWNIIPARSTAYDVPLFDSEDTNPNPISPSERECQEVRPTDRQIRTLSKPENSILTFSDFLELIN